MIVLASKLKFRFENFKCLNFHQIFVPENGFFDRLKIEISHWTGRRSKSGKNGQEPNLQHAFLMFRMCSRISNSHYQKLFVTEILQKFNFCYLNHLKCSMSLF